MNWRSILSQSNDLEVKADLLICADWLEEHGRGRAADNIRGLLAEPGIALMVGDEPFYLFEAEDKERIMLDSFMAVGDLFTWDRKKGTFRYSWRWGRDGQEWHEVRVTDKIDVLTMIRDLRAYRARRSRR